MGIIVIYERVKRHNTLDNWVSQCQEGGQVHTEAEDPNKRWNQNVRPDSMYCSGCVRA